MVVKRKEPVLPVALIVILPATVKLDDNPRFTAIVPWAVGFQLKLPKV